MNYEQILLCERCRFSYSNEVEKDPHLIHADLICEAYESHKIESPACPNIDAPQWTFGILAEV